MLKFYSHITKKANLRGESLNSLAGLSIENTSEENKNLIEKVFDTQRVVSILYLSLRLSFTLEICI